MDFKIIELNFLYLYKYCQECHINTSVYENYDIEDICEEDIVSLLRFIMYREGISKSYDECLFSEKVEMFLKKSDSDNLAILGTILNKKVQMLLKCKEEIMSLENNVSNRYFVSEFKNLVNKTRDIKSAIGILDKADINKPAVPEKKTKNKRIMNLIFSRKG